MSPTLAMQIASLRHCVAFAAKPDNAARFDVNDEIVRSAMAGIRSLEWVERNQKALRELNLTLDLLTSFPGAEITVTRHDQ